VMRENSNPPGDSEDDLDLHLESHRSFRGSVSMRKEARRVRGTDGEFQMLVGDIFTNLANLKENFAEDVNRTKNALPDEKKQKLKDFVEEHKGRWNELKENGVITEEFPETEFEAWKLNMRACKARGYVNGYREAGRRGQGNGGKKTDFVNVLRVFNRFLDKAC